jgi:hypothetical protein
VLRHVKTRWAVEALIASMSDSDHKTPQCGVMDIARTTPGFGVLPELNTFGAPFAVR